MGFTHFDEKESHYGGCDGEAGHSPGSNRHRKITVNEECSVLLKRNRRQGDVLGVATTAGIMGAKRTSDLIPMCHILPITNCKIRFEKDPKNLEITCFCTVKVTGKTGVEMEALTGVSVALLTIYDMCKALDKFMEIQDIYL